MNSDVTKCGGIWRAACLTQPLYDEEVQVGQLCSLVSELSVFIQRSEQVRRRGEMT